MTAAMNKPYNMLLSEVQICLFHILSIIHKNLTVYSYNGIDWTDHFPKNLLTNLHGFTLAIIWIEMHSSPETPRFWWLIQFFIVILRFIYNDEKHSFASFMVVSKNTDLYNASGVQYKYPWQITWLLNGMHVMPREVRYCLISVFFFGENWLSVFLLY